MGGSPWRFSGPYGYEQNGTIPGVLESARVSAQPSACAWQRDPPTNDTSRSRQAMMQGGRTVPA